MASSRARSLARNDATAAPCATGTWQTGQDDFSRSVHCLLGIPIDAVDLTTALRAIRTAAAASSSYLVSTPNLNFLVKSISDPEFSESLLLSDLCPPDGMAIVWIARLLGIPVKQRVAGSDIFECLRSEALENQRLQIFLFGGAEGVAEAACAALNKEQRGFECVGSLNPGYGCIEEMSDAKTIGTINASHAQILAVALGAKKAQAWLLRNHYSLRVPVRVHLGATLNFAAGVVKRAPQSMRKLGLEWLWRIKEEPHLWRRYAYDGLILLRLLVTHIAPLAVINAWHRTQARVQHRNLMVSETRDQDSIAIKFSGTALGQNSAIARACFAKVATGRKAVTLDLSDLHYADSGFLGLLLMLRKQLRSNGKSLQLTGISGRMARLMRLNGLAWLNAPMGSSGSTARQTVHASDPAGARKGVGVAIPVASESQSAPDRSASPP